MRSLKEMVEIFNTGLYPSNYPFRLKRHSENSVILMKAIPVESNDINTHYHLLPLKEVKGKDSKDIISKVNKELIKCREWQNYQKD